MDSVTRFLEDKLKLRVNRDNKALLLRRRTQVPRPSAALNGKLEDLSQKVKPREGEDQADYSPQPGVSLTASDRRTPTCFLIGWIIYYRFAACRFELQCLA